MADRHDDVSRVDAADVAGDASPAPNGNGARETVDAPPECYYQSLGEFAGWLLAVYRRSTRGQARVFCPQWWKHPEAIARMDALWRAFEQLRQDPGTGMSVFWRDHVDHHLTVLLDADGPFKGCEDGHSEHPLGPLVDQQPPAVLFLRDERGLPRVGGEPQPAAPSAVATAAAGGGRTQDTTRKP